MSIIEKAREAAIGALRAGGELDAASTAYDKAVENAVLNDVPMYLGTGELRRKELAAAAGISDAAATYHAAVIISCGYEAAGVTPSDLRSLWVAARKSGGKTLATLLSEVQGLKDSSTRIDVANLLRKELASRGVEPPKVVRTPETPDDKGKRVVGIMAQIKGPVSALTLETMRAEVARIAALSVPEHPTPSIVVDAEQEVTV